MHKYAILCGALVASVWWLMDGPIEAAPAQPLAARSVAPASRPARPASKAKQTAPRDAVFYQIFVRSFQDSDGDGIGDLNGIIQRLDYLKALPQPASKGSARGQRRDLGITGLWLTPIFGSPSYHGYDTTDYRAINPAYGDMKVFRRLLQEAHKRGIKVILDLMVNHTSNKHPWFLRAAKAKRPEHRAWYVWRGDDPGWRQPWGGGRVWHPHKASLAFYYGIFWSGMPDLNLAHKPAREAIFRIAAHWLKLGVDGLRLDAARHLFADGPGSLQNDRPATHQFWRDFRKRAKRSVGQSSKASSPLLVGEVWSTADVIQRYCKGDQFDLAFHFPLAKAIKLTVSAMEVKPLWKVLQHSLPQRCWATFLANHDQTRIISQLAGDQAMMKAAAFLLLTLPGTPFIYYGEEIGMPNGTKQRGDPAKRTPMAWDASPRGGFSKKKPWTPLSSHQAANVAAQRNRPGSLWRHYQQLIQLRHQAPALRRGTLQKAAVSGLGSGAVVAFVRTTPRQRLLVLRNLNDEASGALTLYLPASPRRQGAATRPRPLYIEGNSMIFHNGRTWQLTLAPGAALVLAL